MAEVSGKDWIVIFPVLGSTIAATFDVGYFYGIDINYFSLFSVSEHVAFALEALPFVLVITALSMFAPLALDFLRARRARTRRAGGSTIIESNKPFYKSGFFWFMLFGFAWALMDAIWDPASLFNWVKCGLTLVLTICVATLAPEEISFTSFVAILGAFGIVGAFAHGYDDGASYRKWKEYRYSVATTKGDVQAKVVRSGERGLMFFEYPTNNLRFLPWGEIKGISSNRDVPTRNEPPNAEGNN